MFYNIYWCHVSSSRYTSIELYFILGLYYEGASYQKMTDNQNNSIHGHGVLYLVSCELWLIITFSLFNAAISIDQGSKAKQDALHKVKNQSK